MSTPQNPSGFRVDGRLIVDDHSGKVAPFYSSAHAAATFRALTNPDEPMGPDHLQWIRLPGAESETVEDRRRADQAVREDRTTMLTYPQVASMLGVHHMLVRRLVRAGELPLVKISERKHRILLADVREYIARGGSGSQKAAETEAQAESDDRDDDVNA